MNAASLVSGRPGASEHAPYYGKYVALVEGDDALAALDLSTRETASLLARIGDERSRHRYAPGKWTLREVFVHLTDVERVFSYRALRIARGDETPLEGFDPDAWMGRAGADSRSWKGIADEVAAVRAATLSLYRSLPPESWTRGGTADDSPVTVRAIAFITAGHEAHHRRIIAEKYL
jgi:uncharacterized damage-inducible protein DinB